MRASRSVGAALASLALVASACGGAADTDSAAASVPDAASVGTEQPADLEAAFVPTAAGGQLDFNTLRGQDVLLWFWAPW